MQRPDDRFDELGRAPAGYLRGEVDDHDLIDATLAQQLLTAFQCGEQEWGLIGSDH
jgi:hypothetical protein